MESEIESSAIWPLLVLCFYALPFLILFGTYFIGRTIEKRHYKSIKKREDACHHIPTITGKLGRSAARHLARE